MIIQSKNIIFEGYVFNTHSQYYAERAYDQLRDTAQYRNGKNKGHVQVNGEKVTWRKL